MKAYILLSDVRISPFDDPPGEVMVLNRPVRERQEEILGRLGLEAVWIRGMEEVRETEFLFFPDYVYCSLACLKGFLKVVSKHRQSRRFALEANPQIELSEPMQDLTACPPLKEGGPALYAFDLYYFNGSDFGPEKLEDLPLEVVPIKQRVAEVDPPFYVRVKEKIRIGMSRSYCMQLKHWTHIYLLNFAALTGLPFEWFPRKLPWLLWRVLTAFTLNPFKLLRRLVIKDRKCSIHPTAVVEASVLGKGVSIAAHAVVRGCHIGDGARIGEAAKVLGSIVGSQAEIAWNSIVSLSVLYPNSCVGTPGVQTAVVGRETFVSSMVLPLDVKFKGGYVSVRHQGRTVTTRMTTLGPCFGHRSRVGAGVTVNCGREIPNDVDILPDPGFMLSRVPEGLLPGGSYVVKQGSLIPIDFGLKGSSHKPEGKEDP